MGLIAEHRKRDLWQRRAVWPVSDFAANLQCPSRIHVLLTGLVRRIRPNLRGGFACLDGFLFRIRVALLRRGHKRCINNPIAKILEIHRSLENLKRVTVLAQTFKMIRQTEKRN